MSHQFAKTLEGHVLLRAFKLDDLFHQSSLRSLPQSSLGRSSSDRVVVWGQVLSLCIHRSLSKFAHLRLRQGEGIELLLISWTGLVTMATAYVAQAFEVRSDSGDDGRVSCRLCNQALYAFG